MSYVVELLDEFRSSELLVDMSVCCLFWLHKFSLGTMGDQCCAFNGFNSSDIKISVS